MGLGKIADMDEIAHARSIRRVIVRAKNLHGGPFAKRRFACDFDEVRRAFGGLASALFWVRARYIKIAKRRVAEIKGCCRVCQHGFGHQL